MDEPKEQHPYIPIQVETLDQVIATLVDSGTYYDVISCEFFHTLKNVKLIHKATTTQSFIVHTSIFIGKVFLHIKAG